MAKIRTSFALSQTALDALKVLAEADSRSQAQMLEVLIARALDAHNARPKVRVTKYRDLKDKYVGEVGTPEREEFDKEVAKELGYLSKSK